LILTHNPNAKTLLDVGCGTGAHLEHLRDRFECEGVDLDDQMLLVAAERTPGVHLQQADMADLDLGRTFDAITCLFGSIAYMRTLERVGEAIRRMARHLNPGGILIVEPFLTPDKWQPGHIYADFVDEPELKIMRASRTARENRIAHIDFEYLIFTLEDTIRETERHTVGLFTDQELTDALTAAGLESSFDPVGIFGDRGMFVATAPTLRP
ncbi:MAG: class I SAM-dependent methyltransferase, partial [Steroidobacteraceae bacterium]